MFEPCQQQMYVLKYKYTKLFFLQNFYYFNQNNKLKNVQQKWESPGVTSFIKDNELHIYIFGFPEN